MSALLMNATLDSAPREGSGLLESLGKYFVRIASKKRPPKESRRKKRLCMGGSRI
jgi:hypothetical protein